MQMLLSRLSWFLIEELNSLLVAIYSRIQLTDCTCRNQPFRGHNLYPIRQKIYVLWNGNRNSFLRMVEDLRLNKELTTKN
jgi:hypothetical protein